MRQITERVSQWSCGRYFMTWGGNELLLQATTDEAARAEGAALLAELEFVDTVMQRLGAIDPNEVPIVERAALELHDLGWTTDEAVDKLRWMEHVNPLIDEATALRRMREVNQRVAARSPVRKCNTGRPFLCQTA